MDNIKGDSMGDHSAWSFRIGEKTVSGDRNQGRNLYMIGAIVGDIAGSRFEFNNYRKKDFELFSEECHVTDDSILTLAVAKAIMETCKVIRPLIGKPETGEKFYVMAEWMANKYLREIGRKYPECGYGGMFAQWIASEVPKPYNSFGNGAAMRVSPAGFAAGTEGEAISLADAVTQVTHNHEEGMKGAEAVAVAVFMARHGKSKMEIRKRINNDYYPLDFTIDVIRDAYEFNETCQGTVPQSIEAFLESTSFEDAIRIAISLGGDSDTLAAITGSVAEAFYGVPDEIRERALAYLDPYLRGIYDDWIAFIRDRKENNNKSTVPEKENKDNGI
jgi:type I restriction enzyme M protein